MNIAIPKRKIRHPAMRLILMKIFGDMCDRNKATHVVSIIHHVREPQKNPINNRVIDE